MCNYSISTKFETKNFFKNNKASKKKQKERLFLLCILDTMNMRDALFFNIYTGSTTSDSAETAGDSEEKQE